MEHSRYQSFAIPLANDMHTHLRQNSLMETVTPLIYGGGCDRVLVMPNTVPPITTCQAAKQYKENLMQLEPRVDYMMTLYLCSELSAQDLLENARFCSVTGIKSYPRGVTTNSEWGVESYEAYYPLFREMEKLGLVLHLHGEVPNSSPLQAEQLFLPQLEVLCNMFPKLPIVLEHVSTKEGIETVKKFKNVAGTITAHHLELTVDDVIDKRTSGKEVTDNIANPHNFCKPLPKYAIDREAIRQVVVEGNPKFFLGSDSAPHRKSIKESAKPAAGVFTQPLLLAYVASIFDRLNCLENLKKFVCDNSSNFFSLPPKKLVKGKPCILFKRKVVEVPSAYPVKFESNEEIVPFMAGEKLPIGFTICEYSPELIKSFDA